VVSGSCCDAQFAFSVFSRERLINSSAVSHIALTAILLTSTLCCCYIKECFVLCNFIVSCMWW